MKNKQKQDFESAVGKLNATYFFREFTFSTNTFKPNPAKELELADKVVWLDDLMILSQIKERIAPPHTTADKERKWFTDEVVKKATRQMRDTLSYLKTYPKIKVRNNRRHVFNIASAQVTQTHRIVIYNPHPLLPSECATKKYHRSKTAGVLMAEMSQRGWLTKEDRKKHGKVWIFHWYKARPGDGKRVENTAVVGRVASFSKESSAWEEVDRRGLNHNIDGANSLMGRITFGELAHSYEKHAVPKLAGTTQRTVRHIIDDYLIPRWGKQSALDIRALDMEIWLGSLPLANPTRDKLRRTMFRVYFKAQKHGLIPCKEETNPVNWVEQSGKSHYKAVIVTPEQAFKILMALPESERVLTLLIAATGLRISEALGLQWQDVDYDNQRINLRRVWLDNKVVERMKTEQSEAPATMSPTLAEVLKCWHQQTPYNQPSDWIFASSKLKGRQPRTASILAADHLRPAAIAAGVVLKPGQRFGFHNLRHSLATFLIDKESDAKTVQGLLRHANVSTTLGLYAQSVTSSMVGAQESMLKAILRNGSDAVN